MIVYATHAGGRYLPMEASLREQPEGKRAVYINITNSCNCDCVFCLRSMKEMAKESSLWIDHDPTLAEITEQLDHLPWEYVSEVVCCGFGEPLMRLDTVLDVLRHVKKYHPQIPTRVNTNGLGELEHGMVFAQRFAGLLDTIPSVSMHRMPNAILRSRARSSASAPMRQCSLLPNTASPTFPMSFLRSWRRWRTRRRSPSAVRSVRSAG